MTKQECAIVEAYTGYVMCAGEDRKYFYRYVDRIMGRPVYTHEHPTLSGEIRKRAKEDFVNLCQESVDGEEKYAEEKTAEVVRPGGKWTIGREAIEEAIEAVLISTGYITKVHLKQETLNTDDEREQAHAKGVFEVIVALENLR